MQMDRVTQKTLAKCLRVSQTTVSRVVNKSPLLKEDTRKRILNQIEKFSYAPNQSARALRQGRTNTLGLILPYFGFLEGYNTARIVSGIGKSANSLGYHLIVTSVPEFVSATRGLKKIIWERRLDGVFAILDPPFVKGEFFSFLKDEKTPFIFVNSNRREKGLFCVGSENFEGSYKAAEHLIKKGYKRIAFLGKDASSLITLERVRGYRKALKDYGVSFSQEIERERVYGSFLEFGYQRTAILLKEERPEAIFCYCDQIAFGSLRAVSELGLKVPEDLAIIGFGDIKESSYTNPTLTTVREDGYQIGKVAMEMMFTLLKGEKLKQPKIKIKTELIIQASA